MKSYAFKVNGKYLCSAHLETGALYYIHGKHNAVPLSARQALAVSNLIKSDKTLVIL